MSEVDRLIALRAAAQGGHIHYVQLEALGLSRAAIRHRIERGLLLPVHRNVYAVGHLPTHPHDRAKGAILAVGPDAALAGRSAAALYGTYRTWTTPLELTSRRDHRIAGLIVRHRPTLLATDIVARHGVRVITPELMVLDIARHQAVRELIRAIDDLRLERRLRVPRLEALLDRYPRHPGARRLSEVLGRLQVEPTRSDWEIDWPPFATERHLPGYRTNSIVCGHRVDVEFPGLLIVEMDGWETHQTRWAFEKDRDQDAHILDLTGIPTVRLTKRRFDAAPAAEAARLHRILAQRRALTGAA
jgi:hypothetical protein